MGVGGGEQYAVGVATPVYFVQSVQVTKEAEWATDKQEKSVVDVYKDSFKINLKAFRKNLDGLASCSSGAGDLSYVSVTPATTVGQNYLQVENANVFQAGCTYQVLPSIGASARGNITVHTVDLANNILYLVEETGAYYPSGTIEGDILVVFGASGTATNDYTADAYTTANVAASLNGIPAINDSSESGVWFGIPKTDWPGVLNAEYIDGSMGALTPNMILGLQSLVQRANGADAEEMDEFIVHANVDQVTAWESLGVVGNTGNTVFHQVDDKAAGERMDVLKKERIKTLAGHDLITNVDAIRNRVDLLSLKYWFRIETKPASLYEVDGITAFPAYGSDGGVAPTTLFYFVTGLQIANNKPRAGAYIDTLAIPDYLGI